MSGHQSPPDADTNPVGSTGADTDLDGASPTPAARSLGVADRLAYALFASRADTRRHERDRRVYRGTNLSIAFDLYVARVHAASWLLAALGFALVIALGTALPAGVVEAAAGRVLRRLGGVGGVPDAIPTNPRLAGESVAAIAVVAGLFLAAAVRLTVVYVGGRYLRWLAAARRSDVARTLPGAVRYLHVLASGSDGRRAMLERVADTDAYGETAVAFARSTPPRCSTPRRHRR